MTTPMSLKVLYTVDKEASPYLTRSKAPVEVRVEQIASPSNDGSQIKVGVVVLSDVLDEICASSPELFSPGADTSIDYNVYCRDICEIDEPLVSYGLLSRLREDSQPTASASNAAPDANWHLVMGRVCSNFSAMLRFQNTDNSASQNQLQQTLEVKLRFSQVATANSSRRSSISGNSSAVPMIKKTSSASTSGTVGRRPTKATELGKPNETAAPVMVKRQTNPKPAPKAVRAQSLPIWNQNKNNQFALPANSIAHKIYLADRAAKESDLHLRSDQDKKPVYQISSLQQDNTVQKTKIDDSVSKRFDFITKKKSKMGKPSIKKPVSKSKSSTTKKGRKDSVPNTSTPITSSISASNKSDEVDEFKLLSDDDLVQQLLGKQKGKPLDFFEAERSEKHDETDNKENVPPRMTPVASRFEDLIGMDFPSSRTPSDIEKALSNPKSDDPMEWFNDLFGSPILSQKAVTPTKDPLTCNTIPIDEDDEATKPPTSDIDRTSPMDTLSMPLYELGQRKQVLTNKAVLSCKDQLRRLPLLSRSHIEAQGHDREDDATSVLNFSTSPKASHDSANAGTKRRAPVSSPPIDDEDYVNTYMQETRRKRRAIPSSPTSMFQYQGVEGDGVLPHDHTLQNEEFSIQQGPDGGDMDSTPATQYRSSDGENTKHDHDAPVITNRQFSHIQHL
ncbi:LADA_0F12508g1_1 [Lachancea dasiensis]|uniref:LADA_0F12508g1_1 n=1 Tax=Lachancea dasiensis TaxID=1072105 RepID=A0A1G4JMJ2_9SACH|nr:LADA_0F12508g1_1 [Lachancea dasiensis]